MVNLDLSLYRAKVLARNFRYKDAEKILEKCIAYWPEDGRPYMALGKILSKQSKLAEGFSMTLNHMLAIPLMFILLPPMYTHSTYWLWVAGFYLLAKVEEAADKPIYSWTHHIISGHSLKHLYAAMVPVFLTLVLVKKPFKLRYILIYI
ncbi:PREDICTED: uncharacterized protein LOC104785821 [Camelina sativa]|uniref:Uncharacterized protein LOC104785821 n=1 Tax=Camelina sativa TaxID=90675 RepID=A0ABM0Z299_CAMSA|nr:PREDICTED: uncharacterized protein LOC104785821 [Camelina sativa]